MEEEDEEIEEFFPRLTKKWKFEILPTSDDKDEELERRKRIRRIKEWTDDDDEGFISLIVDETSEKEEKMGETGGNDHRGTKESICHAVD